MKISVMVNKGRLVVNQQWSYDESMLIRWSPLFCYICSSQLSQSQVQVKLEPTKDGAIVAINGDSQSDDGNYHSSHMNGSILMETGSSEEEVRQR